LSARGVDGVLCGLQIALGGLVFESLRVTGARSLIFLGAAFVLSTSFFTTIHFVNLHVIHIRRVQKRRNLSPKAPVEAPGVPSEKG
jgi:hypothetical protein